MEGASERGCPPKQLEGAEVMAETVKIKGGGAKGFPGQLGEIRVKRLHLAGFRSWGKGKMKRGQWKELT